MLTGAASTVAEMYMNVPRFNASFDAVAAEFGVDASYAQSLGMTALPWAGVLAVCVLSVPLWCARLLCCRRLTKRRGYNLCCSNVASSTALVLALLVCVLGVVCGYVANARLHSNVDETVVVLNDTASQLDADLLSLNQTLNALDSHLVTAFAPQLALTIADAHQSIESVALALANVSEYEEYRLITVHGSLVPVALSAVGGIALWKFAPRSSLAWSLVAVSSWFSSLGQQVNAGGHFALAVASSDLCRMADNATDSGSIAQLPPPERAAFQLVMKCNDTRELDPLLVALNTTIGGLQTALAAARDQSPVNSTLVNDLVGRISVATSAVNIIEYVEQCRAAKAALQRLVPVMCEGAQFNASFLWLLGSLMTVLLLTSCCIATMRARRARSAYERFDDEDFDAADEETPFVRQSTAAKSLDTYERQTQRAEMSSARTSYGATSSLRRGSQVWAN